MRRQAGGLLTAVQGFKSSRVQGVEEGTCSSGGRKAVLLTGKSRVRARDFGLILTPRGNFHVSRILETSKCSK
jgi:hypothetical protein